MRDLHYTGRFARLAWRVIGRATALLVTLLIGTVLYLVIFGFPEPLTQEILRRVNTGSFALEAPKARLHVFRGLTLEDVRIYRKRRVGPPAFEVAHALIRLEPLSWIRGGALIRKIKLSDGLFRPDMIPGPEPEAERESPGRHEVRLELERVRLWDVEVEELTGVLSVEPGRLDFREGHGILFNEPYRGEISGDFSYDIRRKRLTGSLSALLDPHLLIPVMRIRDMPFTIKLVERFRFVDALPRCEVQFRSESLSKTLVVEGKVWLPDSTYREVPVTRADGSIGVFLSPSNTIVTVSPLLLVRSDGIVSGGFTVDRNAETVVFNGVSTIDPRALAAMVGLFTPEKMVTWRFDGPSRVEAVGQVGYRDLSRADFVGRMKGSGMGMGPLVSDDCSLEFRGRGITNYFTDIRGTAYGGRFDSTATLVLSTNETERGRYFLDWTMDDINFGQFSSVFRKGIDDHEGSFWGRLEIEGILGRENLETMKGDGAISIRGGKVFLIPVFGGLSEVLTRIIPGLDFVLRQTDVKTDFTIEKGTIRSEHIRIEGDVLSLSGHGRYSMNQSLDFDVQIKLMKEHTLVAKILRALTYPVTKLLEFRLTGTLEKPVWYPVNFSRDLLERIGIRKKSDSTP